VKNPNLYTEINSTQVPGLLIVLAGQYILEIGGMINLGTTAPRGWAIKDFAAIVPLANQIGFHVLLPFTLGLV